MSLESEIKGTVPSMHRVPSEHSSFKFNTHRLYGSCRDGILLTWMEMREGKGVTFANVLSYSHSLAVKNVSLLMQPSLFFQTNLWSASGVRDRSGCVFRSTKQHNRWQWM